MKHPAVLALALTVCACGGLSTPSGAPDASSNNSGETGGSCASGVCGTADSIGSGAQCAQQFPSDCLGGVCCVLAAAAGPPFIDAADGCFCASPDDLGCERWYRLPGGPGGTCAYGSLCCDSTGGAD